MIEEREMRLSFVALVLLIIPAPSRAAIRPSFSEAYSAWHATHIVVIDIDGRVLESWKGDLKPGAQIDLKPLGIPPTPPVSKWPMPRGMVQKMTDQRRVLFLQREAKNWKPAVSFGGMPVAVVWIEQGQAYAFLQIINPGPSELHLLGMTEGGLKDKVTEASRVQAKLLKAVADPDPTKRARAVLPFLDNRKFYGPHTETLKILAGCGSNVLPVLRPLLEDNSRMSLHSDLIAVIGKAAGKDAVGDLEKLLDRELIYWKNVAPNLDKWWGQEPMTAHYGRLVSALRQLHAIGYTDERRLVRTLRDFWQSKPQLDYIGKGDRPESKSQMVEEAEAIIGK
jgi:hypothetical protein